MAEIDEDFEPELIVRASPQDKARARRRRSMVEAEADDSPRWTFMQFWGMAGLCLFGFVSGVNFLMYFSRVTDSALFNAAFVNDYAAAGLLFAVLAFVSWTAYHFGGRKS